MHMMDINRLEFREKISFMKCRELITINMHAVL